MYKHIEQASYQCYNRSRLSPLPPEPVALNYGCDANHDISLDAVTRPNLRGKGGRLAMVVERNQQQEVYHGD
ncbi:hypothetical protein SLEP1_g40376 [Rubroshorea leprosula]|uniref:Uncharacterized protein n=1 Tax=Rubroshorea leprosula TaxID=152421 RepID=A0AAV5L374_9ROSI|nr:hypothetical protein SLEP1_g40376 [Rubroshorea leprosula]